MLSNKNVCQETKVKNEDKTKPYHSNIGLFIFENSIRNHHQITYATQHHSNHNNHILK